MKIDFFGSSHGRPEPGRKYSSIMVEIGENRYLVDIGTDPICEMINRNLPVESIKAVFVSHMHSDHIGGLFQYVGLTNIPGGAYDAADPAIYLPNDLEKTQQLLQGWMEVTGRKRVKPTRFFSVEEGVFFDDGILRVTAYRTMHMNYSYAFLLEAEGKRVLITNDLYSKEPMLDFPVAALEQPLDLLIGESAHFDATDYVNVLTGKDVKKMCITHYSPKHIDSIPAFAALMPQLPLQLATDGMQILV